MRVCVERPVGRAMLPLVFLGPNSLWSIRQKVLVPWTSAAPFWNRERLMRQWSESTNEMPLAPGNTNPSTTTYEDPETLTPAENDARARLAARRTMGATAVPFFIVTAGG